jgi:hypothetical protein
MIFILYQKKKDISSSKGFNNDNISYSQILFHSFLNNFFLKKNKKITILSMEETYPIQIQREE